MPPTFVYFLALSAYLCFGAVALALAAALAVVPAARVMAKRLAGGVIGSYPGVFLFQALSLPVLMALGLLIWLLNRAFQSDTVVAAAVGLTEAMLILGVFAAASLAGFVTGWSVGAEVATGMSIRAALGRAWLVRKFRELRIRRRRETP
jgi:hypothetical protein